MGKVRSQLRHVGYWPDGLASANPPPELTSAARRLAMSALEELNRLGVAVTLDKARRAHFRSVRIPPLAASRVIELHGDLIETYLVERAMRESGR